MGLTIAEKIMSRQNAAGNPVKAGDLIDARVNGVMARQWSSVHARYQKMGFKDGPPLVWDADKTYVILEHNQPPMDEAPARGNRVTRNDVARLGLKHFHDSELGIGQQIMMDNGYVRPGELVVGNDSHTIAIGALNAAATGIGYDELAYVIAFGELFFTVPQTIKVTLRGKNRPYPFAKDIVLWLAGQYGDAFAQSDALEFDGPLAAAMDLSSRMTLADHAVEVGA